MPIQTNLVSALRRAVQDVRPSRRAFAFGLVDSGAQATLEVRNGRFMVQVIGGAAPSIDLRFSDPRFDTVGGITTVLKRTSGYEVAVDEDASFAHPTSDIQEVGPVPLVPGRAVDLYHHLFSDFELEEVLTSAIQRHNATFTIQTLPPQEETYVITLARAEICKKQAYDASKRKGLDATVADLLAIAESLEAQYASDVERNKRVIQSPREANPNIVDEGDVMLGKLNRRSLRTGFVAPISAALPPDPAILRAPEDHDIEDENVRIRWEKNGNYDFYSYELWMDATSDVVRGIDAGIAFDQGASYIPNNEGSRQGAVRPTSSKLAFRALGANSNSARPGHSSFVEEYGQSVKSFAVGKLEPETTYYFRLYIVNLNFMYEGSNVIAVTTKALRARFMPQGRPDYRPGPVGDFSSLKIGPAGSVVTITLDPTSAPYTAQHTFRVGEKLVTPVISGGGFTLTVTIPSFTCVGPKDFVITSPTRLVDVRQNAFQVTT